jgi:Transposase DDE domain
MLEASPPRPGMVIIADKGYASREFEDFVRELGALLVRPDRRDEPRRWGSMGWIRQRIESVNDTLKGQLGLEQHGGRTHLGVYARVAQRLLALNAAIWHNWLINAPAKRSLVAYDH